MTVRRWHVPGSAVEGFTRLEQTLVAACALPTLDTGQRHVLRRRVDQLLDGRERFLVDFHATWSGRAAEEYRALAAPGLSDIGLRDELLHLAALVQLTLADGAETAGHLARTAGYVRALAASCGDSPESCAQFGYAALVHDVGLAVVPEAIIGSRTQVDSYEALLLDTHTRAGAKLVDAVCAALGTDNGPLALARDVALCHHERFDGLGPQGLSGEAIPYAARLFAIADVYDTLRRRRPHRDALDHAATVVAIRAGNRDGQARFDPALLPALLDVGEAFDRQFLEQPDPD